MNIKLLLFGLCSFVFFTTTAQEHYLKKRWNIKLGYSRIPSTFIGVDKSNFRLECNYGLNKHLEFGGYLGGSVFQKLVPQGNGLGSSRKNMFVGYYGLNSNFHILPFIIKDTAFRFDLYVSGKIGSFYYFSPANSFPYKEEFFDYGLYGGAAFYPFKHVGLFLEYGYANNTQLRYGLTIKF